VSGTVGNTHLDFTYLEKELSDPTPTRIFAIAEAIKRDYPVERIYELSRIDKWFLSRMQAVVDMEKRLRHLANQTCTPELLLEAKQMGFSDLQIAGLTGSEASEIRQQRIECHIGPCVKQIDTLAAEYPAQTNYLYLTYNGTEDDIRFGDKKSVMVLGSGAYCIGSSVEFD